MNLKFPIFIGLCALLTSWFPTGLSAQEILIFRPLDQSQQSVETADYNFHVTVSSFSPLIQIRVNGQPVPLDSGLTWVDFQWPIQLHPGPNRIVVDAKTEIETAQQIFVIHLKFPQEKDQEKGEPETAEEPEALQIVTILGVQSFSNPARAPDLEQPVSGTRTFLVFVPRYDFRLGEESTLRVQGILARDIYHEEEHAILEIGFSQLTTTWFLGEPESGEWSIGAGINIIDQEFDTLIQGVTRGEEDQFLIFGYRGGMGENSFFAAKLELKKQDMVLATPDADRDGDATVVTVEGQLEADLLGGHGKSTVRWIDNQAVGRYMRFSSIQLILEQSYAFEFLIPVIALRSKNQTYAESDPTYGAAPTTTTTTFSTTFNIPITSALILMAEASMESRTSNVDPLAYDNTSVSLALVYVY